MVSMRDLSRAVAIFWSKAREGLADIVSRREMTAWVVWAFSARLRWDNLFLILLFIICLAIWYSVSDSCQAFLKAGFLSDCLRWFWKVNGFDLMMVLYLLRYQNARVIWFGKSVLGRYLFLLPVFFWFFSWRHEVGWFFLISQSGVPCNFLRWGIEKLMPNSLMYMKIRKALVLIWGFWSRKVWTGICPRWFWK